MRQAYAGLPGSVLAVLIFCLSLMKMTPVAAELRIDITRGVVEPLPIAILPFQGDSAEAGGVGRDIAGVISADLGNSGLFRPLDVGAQVASQGSLDAPPKFADWRQMNAQALVQGRTAILADGRFKIEFRLWDVFAEQQMVGVAYVTAKNNWRRIAHIIADAIYKRITGEDGYFDTRIVYVAESGPRSRRVKRLAIMDQDGAGNRFLTDGASLVLTPRFSPSMQEIAYVRFIDGSPRVYIRHLDLPREELLGDFPGMTFAPRFSPDGERLIISMAQDGNTDIYTVDLKSRTKRRLTSHSAIDTSASYSPDGRQIVFNSDRSGTPQLYIMDADGSNVRRISYGEGRYTEPAWSPRGDLIAFTKMRSGRFSIGVMRPDGSGERTLADGYQVSGPTWAPNGRVLMFYREDPVESEVRGGRARLFTVDLSGRNEREVVTPLDASDPAWSPLQP